MAKKILFETDLTDTSSSDIEGIGSEREDQYGNKYRWVYNASAFDSQVGSPACYDVSLYSSANFLKHVLAAPADEDIYFFAGIFVSAISTHEYGWIMTWGRYSTARVACASGGAVGTGDMLIPSTLTATDGTAASRPYAFINGADISQAIGTGTGTAYTPSMMLDACARVIEAVTTGAGVAGTTPESATVFVKGL